MSTPDAKCYMGIDVSKNTLEVHFLPYEKHMVFKNDEKGIKQLVRKLKSFVSPLIVMEATGGYEKPLAYALFQANYSLSVVNPRQVRDFAKALGKLAKTDDIDAKVIALYAEKLQPRAHIQYGQTQQEMAENNARRRQLIDMITMEKNRLGKCSPRLKKSIENVIKVLEKELEAINDSQQQVIASHPEYADKQQILTSVKGISQISANALLADLPELGFLDSKQISALAGLAPYNRDSGTLRGKRTIWGGRASVRTALYMPTLVAIRHNPQIKQFYERLCQAGKQKKTALVACMHKLLIILNAMIKHQETWRGTSSPSLSKIN
jgi:transposase